MTATLNEYDKQAQDFLDAASVTFSAVLIGDDCPRFCEDAVKGIDLGKVNTYPRKTHIHGKHYRCTFTRRGSSPSMPANYTLAIDFWNSYNDEEFNFCMANKYNNAVPDALFLKHGFRAGAMGWWNTTKTGKTKRVPRPYDVISCLTQSDPGTFDDFCSEFGYDSDSRRAFAVWEAVLGEWRRVQGFFTAAEIEKVQEIR